MGSRELPDGVGGPRDQQQGAQGLREGRVPHQQAVDRDSPTGTTRGSRGDLRGPGVFPGARQEQQGSLRGPVGVAGSLGFSKDRQRQQGARGVQWGSQGGALGYSGSKQ